jgi:Skp family chaperone for outer membrane proteins
MGPVFDEINEAIHKVGEEEGYDFIFDAVAGNIVYAKEDHDVTDKVLKELGVDTSAGN